ncbi:SGNH/GDSL hydrolase family protein [Anaerocolumna sp.]|uniref:SGNH/GDSL hydrolase family protein n=1 Tax=Anaerocolumna sp. TaxID=2041569 RepID=UPI0028A7DB57|nr:SGNH/GDSL hydrolase family protein [Anaerocolumna sp.]
MISVRIYGDSILKGIQINPVNKKYYVNNNIDVEKLSEKYSIEIKNYSRFGCTVTKGRNILKKSLENAGCDAIVMDYGGNDCDYNWKEISEIPEGNYSPNTPIELFMETYYDIIDTLKKKGILPILTTLPPLEPQSFFNWFCRDLNKKNIMLWLGEIKNIYYHQENYSKIIEKIASDTQVPLVDLRGDFLKSGDVGALLCEDGTHPNTSGQKVIATSFNNFANGLL